MADQTSQGPGAAVIIRSLVYGGVFYIVTALYLVLGSWLLLGPRAWAMKGLELHGRTAVWLLRLICGTKFEVRGQDNLPSGGCLVIAKHQSAWDTFGLVPLFRDPAIVLKDELKWIPFYGWFCIKFEHILVKREKASAALKRLIQDARQRLSAGREVVIFPEGTRTIPGAAPDYKPGYVALYEALGVPAVPMALNSGLFWPRRSLWRYPGTIVVEFLPAVPPGLPRAEFRGRVERDIEAASRRLIEEASREPNPPPLAISATQAN
ncbi:1-acyl-sn-glycerol-3-phosphate acyltransferase [Hyphomicrobium methylovorum]|uniref:lysophospholipid acyltransferase family protein n=1 Tax=Hyphomicrobium methylovorum TaxID=84 RepID=UPI0015E638AE|nr:lysophospholipid acyltransferase family protein [Hyphomicrobium methylovorum]MBA2125741.1 1-acyl-sn-glycerol-3-phosphate acyltransferase [Hyphomicrobium methylovorum]